MQAKIICSVPTVYQASSISTLMGNTPIQTPQGNLVDVRTFPTTKQAIQWLKDRAYKLYSEGTFEGWEYKEAMGEIKKYKSLTYDAATARIEVRNEK